MTVFYYSITEENDQYLYMCVIPAVAYNGYGIMTI